MNVFDSQTQQDIAIEKEKKTKTQNSRTNRTAYKIHGAAVFIGKS